MAQEIARISPATELIRSHEYAVPGKYDTRQLFEMRDYWQGRLEGTDSPVTQEEIGKVIGRIGLELGSPERAVELVLLEDEASVQQRVGVKA